MVHLLGIRFRFMLPLALLATLLAACAPAATAVVSTSTPAVPTGTSAPPAPTTHVQETAVVTPADSGVPVYTLDLNGVAQGIVTESVPAVQPSDEAPWWSPMPQHLSLTLQGYPIRGQMKPQIFIYPAKELLDWNKQAAKQVEDLRALLERPQVGASLPFLPLINASQVMHAQVVTSEFKNGKGLRFLTQYAQGLVAINNYDLFYTYQGLTNDGRYYVAAVLPVNYSGLPADGQTLLPTSEPFWSDYPGYVSGVVKTLDQELPDAFTPILSRLDEMMMSVEVK